MAGQLGSATVVYVGSAFGGSLVSVHHVKDHETDVKYWLVIGNISRLAPDISVGMKLAGDTLLGELGPSNSKSQSDFSLWLDCYRLRTEPAQVDWQRFPENLKTITEAIPVDLRDVLPFL